MDTEVIEGATDLIKRCQPYISMEANYTKAGKEIIKYLRGIGYEIYEADCFLYSKNNDFQINRNIFLQYAEGTQKYTNGEAHKGKYFVDITSYNWLCIPKSKGIKVQGIVVDENKWVD